MDYELNIEKKMLDMHISQTKLAHTLNTNLTTVNNWFKRGSIPSKYHQDIDNYINSYNNSLFNVAKESTTSTNKSYLELSHMSESRDDTYIIDVSTVKYRDIDRLRFDRVVNNYIETVNIVDISVDKYLGDSIYYIRYPHKIEPMLIKFNPLNNLYLIIDFYTDRKLYEVSRLSVDILGKVICKIDALK